MPARDGCLGKKECPRGTNARVRTDAGEKGRRGERGFHAASTEENQNAALGGSAASLWLRERDSFSGCDRFAHDGSGWFGRFRGQMVEERIAALAGDADVFCAQRTADALLGERSGVHGVVQEPCPVVVPQMMIRVFRADADAGQSG